MRSALLPQRSCENGRLLSSPVTSSNPASLHRAGVGTENDKLEHGVDERRERGALRHDDEHTQQEQGDKNGQNVPSTAAEEREQLASSTDVPGCGANPLH